MTLRSGRLTVWGKSVSSWQRPGCPRTPGRRPGQVTNEQVAHAAGNEWLSEDRIASTGLAERRGGGNGCCSDSAEADPRRCHAPSWPLSSCSSSGIPGTAQSISAFGLVLRRRGASRASSSGRRFWSTARPGRHPLGDGGPSSCTWWTRSGTNEILFFTSRAVDRQLERRCPDPSRRPLNPEGPGNRGRRSTSRRRRRAQREPC